MLPFINSKGTAINREKIPEYVSKLKIRLSVT